MGRRAFRAPSADQMSALVRRYEAGAPLSRLARESCMSEATLRRQFHHRGVRLRGCSEAAYLRHRSGRRSDAEAAWRRRPGPLALVIGRSPDDLYSGAERLSERLRTMLADVRFGGPMLVGPLTVAAAHAAGLTLDDIEAVFAIPPAEAVAMIAAGHGGR